MTRYAELPAFALVKLVERMEKRRDLIAFAGVCRNWRKEALNVDRFRRLTSMPGLLISDCPLFQPTLPFPMSCPANAVGIGFSRCPNLWPKKSSPITLKRLNLSVAKMVGFYVLYSAPSVIASSCLTCTC
ncbi:unnamed protein product [Linum trigynum]|uniref:F-box domain-containing protein n=1 Tax=Linum trigynum TaxID=586398 RepID=A0AAV2E0E6_9ROSI